MSVEPRNALWNRLLARAEARAKREAPPETHLFRPRSPGDRHLRASLENSLIYHGLKIDTEFNLRLQRPPRKRKAKRKGDLPVAERLRNDRAAAGSPGPTHRTPTGTPARRISKTTPLSRPPIPPAPPLPPIPASTRAAAARERVLNAVSDDDEPPVRVGGPVVELSDSSDDGVFLSRTTKPDGGAVIVLPHFDQAANSNDTSSWEEDAILVQQPPREQDSDGNTSKKPESDVRTPSDTSLVMLELGPRYTTSRHDRSRRAKSRKIASSDSSPAPDSALAKDRNENHFVDNEEAPRQKFGLRAKESESPNTNARPAVKERKEMDTSKRDVQKSKKDMSENGDASEERKDPCNPCPKNTSLVAESLLSRTKTFKWLQSVDRQPSPVPILSLSSSSNDERSRPSRRPSPPMRAVALRRRTPSDVSVEDKLFGPLLMLRSPRRGAKSLSRSGACDTSSDGASSAEEMKRRTSPRRRNHEKTDVASNQRNNTMLQIHDLEKIPLRRSPRTSRQSQETERRSCDLEVIATGPSSFKQTSREEDYDLTKPSQSGGQRRTVRKTAPRESSSEVWEDEASLNPIDVDAPTSLPKKTRSNKSSPVSSPSGRKDDGYTTNGKKPSTRRKRRTSSELELLCDDTPEVLQIRPSPDIPKKTRGNKSPPVSSHSGGNDDSHTIDEKKLSVRRKGRTSDETELLCDDTPEILQLRPSPGIGSVGGCTDSGLIRIGSLSLSDYDYESSDDQSKYIAIPRNKVRPLKRKRAVRTSSKSAGSMHNQNKPFSLQGAAQGKSSLKSAKAKRKESTMNQKNAGSSSEVLEIRESDSDVCIVSFSPAKAKGSSTNNPRKLSKHDVSREGNGKNSSNSGKREALRSFSGDSSVSPLTRSPTCKIPLRIRRPIKLRPSSRNNSKSPAGRANGSGITQAGQSLIVSESDEGSGKEVKQAVRTSPRRKTTLLLDEDVTEHVSLKGYSKSPSGLSDAPDGTERVVISSDSDEGSRKADMQKVRTYPVPTLPLRIPLSSEGRARRNRLVPTSDCEGSDSSLVLLRLDDYEKTKVLGKKSKRKSVKRGRESTGKGRGDRERSGSSSSGAENSDSCLDVDRALNVRDRSKEASRKRRRRK